MSQPNNDYEFLQSILEILFETQSWGWFSRHVEIDGAAYTYRFSQSTGLGSNHYRRKYIEHFKSELPDWIDLVHPASIFGLCKLAIEADMQLPEELGGFYLAHMILNKKRAD